MDEASIQKLAALLTRVMQPPTVNVNITMDGLKKKKEALSGPEVNQPEMPDPGGMPRPYTS